MENEWLQYSGYDKFQIARECILPFHGLGHIVVDQHQECQRQREDIDHAEYHDSRVPVHRVYQHQPYHEEETGGFKQRGQELEYENIRQCGCPYLAISAVEEELVVV